MLNSVLNLCNQLDKGSSAELNITIKDRRDNVWVELIDSYGNYYIEQSKTIEFLGYKTRYHYSQQLRDGGNVIFLCTGNYILLLDAGKEQSSLRYQSFE